MNPENGGAAGFYDHLLVMKLLEFEWTSMLMDFGIQVTLIEYANRVLPTEEIVTRAKVLPETLD
ncbi:hypothetical protein V7108_10045 [Neobacillus vireti]